MRLKTTPRHCGKAHRIDQFDKTVAKLIKRITETDATLADPKFYDPKLYDRDPARVASLGKERAATTGALAERTVADVERRV